MFFSSFCFHTSIKIWVQYYKPHHRSRQAVHIRARARAGSGRVGTTSSQDKKKKRKSKAYDWTEEETDDLLQAWGTKYSKLHSASNRERIQIRNKIYSTYKSLFADSERTQPQVKKWQQNLTNLLQEQHEALLLLPNTLILNAKFTIEIDRRLTNLYSHVVCFIVCTFTRFIVISFCFISQFFRLESAWPYAFLVDWQHLTITFKQIAVFWSTIVLRNWAWTAAFPFTMLFRFCVPQVMSHELMSVFTSELLTWKVRFLPS